MRYSFESTSSIDNTTSTSLYHRIVISTFSYVFHFNSTGIFICNLKIFPRDFKIIFYGIFIFIPTWALTFWLNYLWNKIWRLSYIYCQKNIFLASNSESFNWNFSRYSPLQLPWFLGNSLFTNENSRRVNPQIRLIEDRNELKIILCVEWLYLWVKLIQTKLVPTWRKHFNCNKWNNAPKSNKRAFNAY